MLKSTIAMSPFSQKRFAVSQIMLIASAMTSCDNAFLVDTSSDSKSIESRSCQSELFTSSPQLDLISDENVDTEVHAQALMLGEAIIDELDSNLLEAGYQANQAQFIAEVAAQSLDEATGSFAVDVNLITEVAPPIVKGAFLALADPCAELGTYSLRSETSKILMQSSIESLGGRIDGLDLPQTGAFVGVIASTAVNSMSAAELGGLEAPKGLSSITSGTVGSLNFAGLGNDQIGTVAKSVASGAVTALLSLHSPSANIGDLAGSIASAALTGLGEAGLSSEEIIDTNAISDIVSGASSGLKGAGVEAKDIGTSIGSIAGSAIKAFETAGIDNLDLKTRALSKVIEGAVDGVDTKDPNIGELMSDTLHAVSKTAVSSLKDAGFSASEISGATSTIVRTSITAIATSGITDSDSAISIASQVMSGAMEATAQLENEGTISAAQSAESGAAASVVANSGLTELESAGIVSGDTAKAKFRDSISTSISTGFTAGGGKADTLTSIEATTKTNPVVEVAVAQDTTPPTVSSLNITSADGTYELAGTIEITVHFSEKVTVTGSPTLTLETGSTDRDATFTSGSGSALLNFTYTVQAGDMNAALDYVSTTSLRLNGGSIKDLSNNNALLTLFSPGGGKSLTANKNIVVDTSLLHCDSGLSGINLLRSVASDGTATVKEIAALNGASIYGTDNLLEQCSGSWQSQGTFCDDGDGRDSKILSHKTSWSNIATWSSGGVSGDGVLVVDLGAPRVFDELVVFQMDHDGQITNVNFYTHPETGETAPLHTDSDWSSSILSNGDYAYVSGFSYTEGTDKAHDPTVINLAQKHTTRYLRIYARNDNTQGGGGYIEIRSIKMFCD